MAMIGHQKSLASDLGDLALALESLALPESRQASNGLVAKRDRLIRSIRSYSIPRLTGEQGPLLVVFAGPTGSGKSTLINSLSGLDMSETGPLRPTTTGPLVLAGPTHASAMREISGVDCEVTAGGAPLLSTIALVDTPDLDSTSTQNRAKAEILIDNADVVVFVTSALRYADLVPWEVLRRATSRGAPVINVINRLGAGSGGAITDFRARLNGEGLEAEVIRVPEHHIPPGGHRLPGPAVRELQREILARTAAIEADRREVVDRVVRSTAAQVVELADEIDSSMEAVEEATARAEAMIEDVARMMDITSLCDGLITGAPSRGVLGGLIWTWRNRLSEGEWREAAATIEQRLIAVVESDVRGVVADVGPGGSVRHGVVRDLRSQTSSSVRDWLGWLEELAGPSRRFGGRLATLVLAQAAVSGLRTPAFDRLFEDVSLISRAQGALAGSLEELLQRVGSQLGAGDDAPWSRGDTDRLRELAAAVSARSHFADA